MQPLHEGRKKSGSNSKAACNLLHARDTTPCIRFFEILIDSSFPKSSLPRCTPARRRRSCVKTRDRPSTIARWRHRKCRRNRDFRKPDGVFRTARGRRIACRAPCERRSIRCGEGRLHTNGPRCRRIPLPLSDRRISRNRREEPSPKNPDPNPCAHSGRNPHRRIPPRYGSLHRERIAVGRIQGRAAGVSVAHGRIPLSIYNHFSIGVGNPPYAFRCPPQAGVVVISLLMPKPPAARNAPRDLPGFCAKWARAKSPNPQRGWPSSSMMAGGRNPFWK